MATRTDDQVHFDLAMSPSTSGLLSAIASERQTSVSDLLARAVALLVEAEKARKAGGTLGVLDRDKQPVAELVGF